MARRSDPSNGSAGPPEFGDQALSGRILQQNDASYPMSAMRRWWRGGRISVGRRWRVGRATSSDWPTVRQREAVYEWSALAHPTVWSVAAWRR